MPREPLVIGPFAGGLNTYDDPTAVKDTELVEALNWDPGLEGSLRSRPPFQDLAKPLTLGTSGSPRFLGFFYGAGGTYHLIVSDGLSSTWAYNGTAWSLITSTFAASAMAQFDNKAWLLSPVGEADPGGYWTPGGGFVADADMPRGDTIVSFKSRLWMSPGKGNVNGTRVYYSKVLGQPNFWQSAAFVDVGQGDGQDIVYLATYYNTLIAFRTQSIFAFSFSTDPAQGAITLLVPGVGLTSKDCVIAYENYLYFMYDEKAYQFINNNAQQINLKVPFTATSLANNSMPFSVSLFNNRAIFHYYDTMYVYSLRTKTWTRWKSPQHGSIGQIMSPAGILTDEAFVNSSAVVPSGAGRTGKLLYIVDAFTNATETYTCEVQTKNYNYQLSSNFKRLFWWGVDAVFRTRIRGWAVPVVHHSQVTWGQLRNNYVVQRTNIAKDPTSSEVSTWLAVDSGLLGSLSSIAGWDTPTAIRFTRSSSSGTSRFSIPLDPSKLLPFTEYRLRFKMRLSAGTTISLAYRPVGSSSATGQVAFGTFGYGAGTGEYTYTFTTGAAVPVNPALILTWSSGASGSTVDIEENLLVKSSEDGTTFFSGASPSAGPLAYAWLGAVNASASEERLHAVTWGTLLGGTWGSPFIGDLSVFSDYDLKGTGPMRKFVKMFKSMRFRQIYFKLAFDTDGSIGSAPINLFTITAYVGSKETVSKTVS